MEVLLKRSETYVDAILRGQKLLSRPSGLVVLLTQRPLLLQRLARIGAAAAQAAVFYPIKKGLVSVVLGGSCLGSPWGKALLPESQNPD